MVRGPWVRTVTPSAGAEVCLGSVSLQKPSSFQLQLCFYRCFFLSAPFPFPENKCDKSSLLKTWTFMFNVLHFGDDCAFHLLSWEPSLAAVPPER